MKLLLITNPHARSGRAGQCLEQLQTLLNCRGLETETLLTERAGHARKLVSGSNLKQYDGILAAGGDGTLFEIVNGLMDHPLQSRVPMGVIPLGTGNAFARDLGLEANDLEPAVDIIHAGGVKAVDVGHVKANNDEFYFINVMGTGFVVAAGLAAKRFKAIGNASYTAGTLSALIGLESQSLTIELDGRRIEQDNLFVEICNSRYTGTHFLIAPGASLSDGLLDVVMVRRASRLRLLRLFPTIYEGRHVEFDEVTVHKAEKIRILSPARQPLAPDGEFIGETPVEVNCLREQIEVFFPAQ